MSVMPPSLTKPVELHDARLCRLRQPEYDLSINQSLIQEFRNDEIWFAVVLAAGCGKFRFGG
jgi:hypothetical protein